MFPSLQKSWEEFKEPRFGEHIRPVLQSIAEAHETEDLIYVYCSSVPAFQYYEPLIFPAEIRRRYGKKLDKPERFWSEVKLLTGRTWFVFSHPSPPEGIEYIEEHVESLKLPKLAEFSAPGARAFLVQLP